jgi:hypothetical protein
MMEKYATVDYSRTHDITIGEVKACLLFAHLTDSEAKDIVETLKLFTKIAYDFYKKEHKNHGNAIENP